MTRTHRQYQDQGFIEDQREFFDTLIVQDWDSYLNPLWDRSRRQEVRDILRRVPPPASVLDLGCGDGFRDKLFARLAEVERVVGLDYSPRSIQQAERAYPHPRVKRYVADFFTDHGLLESLARFDLVVSFQVIEHLTRPQEFMNLCAGMTKPGGHVVVGNPNRRCFMNRIRPLFGRPPAMSDPLHFAEYSLEELSRMGRGAGLEPVACFGHTFYLPYLSLKTLGLKLGRLLPSLSSVIGLILEKPAGPDGKG